MDAILYVILGRTGDVLAALPIIQHEREACVLISREYAPVLDGTSVQRLVFEGDWRHVSAAYSSVRKGWPKIVVLQQYTTDGWPVQHGTDSFVQEMYRCARKLTLFPLPLKFDKRDPERESRWTSGLPSDKPIILTATLGLSSPFAQGEELRALLHATFYNAHIVNLDSIRAERIYDLLALLERAACLITIDSALLHLAQAVPKLPVIALIADRPTPWHGSPKYAGQRLRIRYSDYSRRRDELLATVVASLQPAPLVGCGPAPG